MRSLSFILFLVLVISVYALAPLAHAQFQFVDPLAAFTPFGGMVGTVLPVCINGVVEVYMTPFTLTPPLVLYGAGSFSYSYGPPLHAGQFLIGRLMPLVLPCIILIPCTFGMCPFPKSFGPPIFFHGSSI
jgi:hypothetical protein